MKTFRPDKVFVETAAANLPRTGDILTRLGDVEIEYTEDHRKIDIPSQSVDERFRLAKRTLALAVKQGSLVKEFRRHSCLRQEKEYYLVHAANCPFDCSYCYLQSYYENAVPTIFVNTDDLFSQVRQILQGEHAGDVLFHAGETADALALEQISGFAADAVGFFAGYGNAALELRTKSANVDAILPLDHRGRTVVSWTLTPRRIIADHECDAAPLEPRLEAARRCHDAGYPVGLRFDPVIFFEGWQDGYVGLVEEVRGYLDPNAIHSIVIGGFRFPPSLRDIYLARNGRDEIILAEFIPSPDGKLRYFRHIREEMYREIIGSLRRLFGNGILQTIELAMEPDYVWRNVGLPANP